MKTFYTYATHNKYDKRPEIHAVIITDMMNTGYKYCENSIF